MATIENTETLKRRQHEPQALGDAAIDCENLKRRIADLEACLQDLPDLDEVPLMPFGDRLNCFKKLKTMQEKLAKTQKVLKGYDATTSAWDKEKTLKLSGFKRGFHPKRCNIMNFFKRSNITVVDHEIILDDNEEEDFIILLFASLQDVDRALFCAPAALLANDDSLTAMDVKFPATCAKGVHLFDAVLTRMSD
jgi:hypothetical protein